MPAIVIRGIDAQIKLRLRVRAAQHNRSMEEEVRVILANTLAPEPPPPNLATAIRARVEPVGGIELPLPPRASIRKPPKFS